MLFRKYDIGDIVMYEKPGLKSKWLMRIDNKKNTKM